MTGVEIQKLRDERAAASEIATLAKYLSAALSSDPDTALVAEAIDGIERLALMLASRLDRFAEASA